MNRKYQSFIASLVLLVLFGVMTGCRETPINNNPVPRGSQFVGEINGVVRDGNTGAPLSGVTLRLIGPDGDLSTTTNADGIYIFRNLQAGVYKIAAVAPAGYAATRTQDGIELRQQPNQSTGVAVVRVARDFRFFTANASLSGTLQYQTPGGQLLPVPAGTPVFVNFVKATEPGREVTVGDVQVTLVRDSVRAGGAVSISGLPAVGALSQAGETPYFIVPVFTVDGVTYGDPNTGKALNYAIAGLRPGVTFTLPPAATTITSTAATLPLALTATNMNSRTNFGTTDTIFVAFNKPINTFSFSLYRTQTPYIGIVPTSSTVSIASTAAGSLIATALPAGAVPQLGGTIVGANQAFAIRLNRPFVTGSEHRLDINVTATDGTTLSLGATGAVGARTFTTVPGIRLLSVTAGGATPVTLSPTTTTVGVPTSGTITFNFDRPPVGPYFTRGPLRNVRFASGSDNPGFGTDELGRVGIQGETNRIDCVGVITGNSLSFGYRNLIAPGPNATVGILYQIHASLVNLGPEDQPISTNAVAPGTLGNFRSAIPGDFGVVAVLSNRASEFSSFRAFTAAVRAINIPRIASVRMPANPGDSVRITFTRPMSLSVGQTFPPSGNISMFRTGGTAPQPYGLLLLSRLGRQIQSQ
jgi:Cna protein B-type domain.